MKEEVRDRTEVLYLDEVDRLSKLQVGSEEYAKTAKFVTDLLDKMNAADKNLYEKDSKDAELDLEMKKLFNEQDSLEMERESKSEELSHEKKKSKFEFWARIGTAALSIVVPVIVAIAESKGAFVKLTNLKPNKF